MTLPSVRSSKGNGRACSTFKRCRSKALLAGPVFPSGLPWRVFCSTEVNTSSSCQQNRPNSQQRFFIKTCYKEDVWKKRGNDAMITSEVSAGRQTDAIRRSWGKGHASAIGSQAVAVGDRVPLRAVQMVPECNQAAGVAEDKPVLLRGVPFLGSDSPWNTCTAHRRCRNASGPHIRLRRRDRLL